MKKVKVGVIGTGVMGGFHTRQYGNLAEVELVGIFDEDRDRAKEAAEKHGTKAFEHLEQLILSVDALSIATPTSTHYIVGMACLDAGKHVLIEKPITLNLGEADDLIEKAKEKKLVLAVGHIERFNPAYRRFKELLKDINIDTIKVIDAKRLSPYPERITDASVVLDIMIHDIDLVLNMVNSKVSKISATGEKVRSKSLDKATANITFENGIVADLEADRIHAKKVRDFNVTANDHLYEIDLIKKEIIKKVEHETENVEVSLHDQLQIELSDFINAVLKNRKPLVTGEEGRDVLKIALKIEELASK
ncbi:Gfo/Idh/MocA family protein [Candidatus Margulisiibacteriota bacterium]